MKRTRKRKTKKNKKKTQPGKSKLDNLSGLTFVTALHEPISYFSIIHNDNLIQ